MNILIACHAGVRIGLGHLSRMLVAARTLRDQFGAEVKFLIQGDTIELDDLAEFDHKFLRLDQNFVVSIKETSTENEIDIVMFDFSPKHVSSCIGDMIVTLHKEGRRVVAIDGLLEYCSDLDLIFIPSFRFVPPSDLKDGAPVVFGRDCFLLDTRYKPIDWRPGRRILVLSGGSDATGLGEIWPSLLEVELPVDSELHWVTGPFASSPNWPVSPRIRMYNHHSPDGLGNLMLNANYAVTPFGVSLFELLYFGIPTVVFSPYGEKDKSELADIADSGVALVARDVTDATDVLVDLMKNENRAIELSIRARSALAIHGENRLCVEIENLMRY